MKTYKDVDEYIVSFPKETQMLLEQMRTVIRKAAPKALEVIAYGMPAYKYKGALVYFGGYKNHLGFYPTGYGITTFKDELSAYKSSKATLQFTLDKKLPIGLSTKIVKFRVKENDEKEKEKPSK